MLTLITAYSVLFFGSFAAATLLPLPSEAILIGSYEAGLNIALCLIVATCGNFLGGLTNYYIGLKCNNEQLIRRFKFSNEKIDRWEKRFAKWGAWLGLISWIPFVGDPMLVILGFFKVNVLPLSITMIIGKFLRYLVLTMVYLGVIN